MELHQSWIGQYFNNKSNIVKAVWDCVGREQEASNIQRLIRIVQH